MFEAICLSIRVTCKANPAAVVSFEEALFLVFTEILQNDVQGECTDGCAGTAAAATPEAHSAFPLMHRVHSIRLSSDVFASGNAQK